MARTVKEWIGKTDDAMPPKLCKLRIVARQNGKCALTDRPFTEKEKPQFDHITPLWLGGKNCESNLQAIHRDPHKAKTAAEATVRAKVNANAANRFGIKSSPKGRGFPKPAKEQKPAEKPPLAFKQIFTSQDTRS
jgi:5-methylcytosine-specific restriction protein A